MPLGRSFQVQKSIGIGREPKLFFRYLESFHATYVLRRHCFTRFENILLEGANGGQDSKPNPDG